MNLMIDEIFRQKGSDRIQINNLLSSICIGMLTILLTLSKFSISKWILVQLSCAIPCLYISSLSYSKIVYREPVEMKYWDNLGWFLHMGGYVLVINSLLLLLLQTDNYFSFWVFLIFTWISYFLYSFIDVKINNDHIREKSIKLYVFSFCLFVGSIIPLILDLV
jgi:hypothetical protein